jgi:hypothetical protein
MSGGSEPRRQVSRGEKSAVIGKLQLLYAAEVMLLLVRRGVVGDLFMPEEKVQKDGTASLK